MQPIDDNELAAVCGGATPSQSQAELRSLAQKWCPTTYARNERAPSLTRRMGEQCLDEAGYGNYKSMLDRYFRK
jgi:hypothetical protein